MSVEPGGLARLHQLINDAADLAVISLFLVASTIFFLPGIQRRWSYAGASVAMGIVLGLAARWSPLPDGFEILGTMAGVLGGPVTVLKLQGKDVFEIIDEIKRARRSSDGDAE